jgi:hypothetical protein
MLLQVQRARAELTHFIGRWEFEVRARSSASHLDNVGTACGLLLEKMIRIQGHETEETRRYEIRLAALQLQSRRLWEPGPERRSVAKARARLRLVQ